MIVLLADQSTSAATYWLLMALLVLLVGGLALAYVLGRMLGPRSSWARHLSRSPDRHHPQDPTDPWSESGRRLQQQLGADDDRDDDSDLEGRDDEAEPR